jgi:hypothetical protein
MTESLPFLPGHPPHNLGPLGRYLPPIPDGVVSTWLRRNIAPGSWLLDPFGASPRTAVEAVRAGYRVLVAANNPVARFLLEKTANPPGADSLRAALAELSASYKGSERIEPHIQSLYQTECAQCGQSVIAEAFLWERDAAAPFARIYHCPHCNDSGERPTTLLDIERARRYSSGPAGSLHRARALERVAHANDPDRPYAEEALEVYPPRAVYALFTLINKLDQLYPSQPAALNAALPTGLPAGLPAGLQAGQERRANLEALLLAAADQANALWPYPTARARPRQLSVPPRYRENNIWLALEEAITSWQPDISGEAKKIGITTWPEQPPEAGGLCIFEGRFKELSDQLSQVGIKAVLTAIPRPNQAFWTLSALWAGWLWGYEASAPFKSVLRRRRYDWSWHATALHAVLSNLVGLLPADTPIWGLIGESEPGYISAALASAALAGFKLESVAVQAGSSQAQIGWRSVSEPGRASELASTGLDTEAGLQTITIQSGLQYLEQRGEPADYLSLHSAALEAVCQAGVLTGMPPGEAVSAIQNAFPKAFTYMNGFARYGGSEHSLEVGLWWLRQDPHFSNRKDILPLADRAEIAAVRFLIKSPGCNFQEIETAVCAELPGLMTPDSDLLWAILESYGEKINASESLTNPALEEARSSWRLQASDAPQARNADIKAISTVLATIGARLGFQVDEDMPQNWRNSTGDVEYAFYIAASTVFGKILSQPNMPTAKKIVALPGSRSPLAAFKLSANPDLSRHLSNNWQFVKFRHIRRLAEDESLSAANLDDKLRLDPLTKDQPQMSLL